MSESKDTKNKEVKKTETSAKSTVKTGEKKPMPKALKIALIVAVAFVGFIVAVFFIAYSATSGAVKVSDDFLNAMQAGDGTTAYSLFSSEAMEQVPEDEFVVLVEQIGPILDTDERTISQEVSKDDSTTTALVVYEIDATDGETYELGINLIEEDGDWKVLNFDSEVKEDE